MHTLWCMQHNGHGGVAKYRSGEDLPSMCNMELGTRWQQREGRKFFCEGSVSGTITVVCMEEYYAKLMEVFFSKE